MRCYICDRTLSPEEIVFDRDHDSFCPCGSCLMIISEIFEDGMDEDEISEQLAFEFPDVFEENITSEEKKDEEDEAEDSPPF